MLSLLISSLIVIGTVTIVVARSGMTRLTTQLLSFKAEEIRKYAWNQWDVLITNGISDLPVFREAAHEAVHSYAASVVRGETEVVTAYHEDGRVLFSTALEAPFSADDVRAILSRGEGIVRFTLNSDDWIGYLFHFEPFDWYVLTSVLSAEMYAEIDEITRRMVLVSVATIIAAGVLLVLLARRLAAPLVELASGMKHVAESREFEQRIEINGADEIRDAAHAFNTMSDELKQTYARLQSIAVHEAEAKAELGSRELEALLILGRLSEYNDHETGLHIIRVGLYSLLLARSLGESSESQRLLYLAAPLHDVGKIAVPESILLKPGPLDETERQVMQQHTTVGHRILRDARSPSLQMGAEIALTHHERYDGCGYPDGISGNDIPLYSRILAVADVFDALTSRRPYKDPWHFDQAIELVAAERGQHFDPRIVDLFLAHREHVRSIFLDAKLQSSASPPVES